ncbi:flagellar protein FlgN [Candidatus Poribacteria bacterium]|nr:flagellar protein FlgN [Candidatus Poribacteria bacterium]
MTSLWDNFNTILEQEIFLYKKLVEMLKNQKNHITNGAIEGIKEATKEENTLVLKLKIIAETRWRLSKKLFSQYGIDSKSGTLSKLIELAEEPYSSMLQEKINILKEIVVNLEQLNMGNFVFFMYSLQYIQSAIQLLTNRNNEYAGDGILSNTYNMSAGYVDIRM